MNLGRIHVLTVHLNSARPLPVDGFSVRFEWFAGRSPVDRFDPYVFLCRDRFEDVVAEDKANAGLPLLLRIRLSFPLFAALARKFPRCFHLEDRNIVIAEHPLWITSENVM